MVVDEAQSFRFHGRGEPVHVVVGGQRCCHLADELGSSSSLHVAHFFVFEREPLAGPVVVQYEVFQSRGRLAITWRF